MNSPLLEKSLDFATEVVLFYEEFSKTKTPKSEIELAEKYKADYERRKHDE